MSTCGLGNYAEGCWLNTILVSLESCDSLLAIFNKYKNDIEQVASKPLFEYQKESSSSLISELSQFFVFRATAENTIFTPINILEALNPFEFPKDKQIDCVEAWNRMMEQLLQELVLVQSDWARNMYLDLSNVLHISTYIEETCTNKNSTDSRCKKGKHIDSIKNYSVPLLLSMPFIDDEDMKENIISKKKAKRKFVLSKYISNYRKKLILSNTCPYCDAQLESEFRITKLPVILKVNFERTNIDGTISQIPVIFPMKLFMSQIEYEFIAMNHHTQGDFDQEKGYSGHVTATAIRKGKLFLFDDEKVRECNIPKNGTFQNPSIISVIYHMVDWEKKNL
jgi:hypothetical protein